MVAQNKALHDLDKPYFGYLRGIYLSFFSRQFYVDVGKRWQGLGINYLFLVMVIMCIPFSIRMTMDFNNYFKTQFVEPLEKIPDFYIQNGKVTLEKPMPFMIKNNLGQVVVIIDATGTVTEMSDKYPNLILLVTEKDIKYRWPKPHFYFTRGEQEAGISPVEIIPLSDTVNQVFNGREWINSSGIKNVQLLMNFVIYPSIVSMFFVFYLAFFLAFTFIAQLVTKLFMKFNLSYKDTCRLLIVSSTPQITLLLIFLALNWIFKWFSLVWIFVFAVYFSYAVLAVKRTSQTMVRGEK